MYFPELKLLFAHIPKTGGQSVTHYIEQKIIQKWKQVSGNYLSVDNRNYRLPGPQQLAHMTVLEHKDLNYIQNSEWKKAKKICVVRNPYDKYVSAYTNYNVANINPDPVNWCYNLPKPAKKDITRHFWPQHFYVCGRKGNLIVDKVFYQTNLDELYNWIDETYFPKEEKIIPEKINVASSKKVELTPELIEAINIVYAKDFELFNFDMI